MTSLEEFLGPPPTASSQQSLEAFLGAPPQQQQQFSNLNQDPSLLQKALVGTGSGIMRTAQGLKQLGLEAGEQLGFVDPETTRDYTQQVQEERELFSRTPVGQSGVGKTSQFIGETLPYFAVPGIGLAGGLGARLAGGAALGSGIGATQFVPEGESRLSNTIGGGLAGGAFSAVAPPIARGIGRAGKKAFNVARGKLRPDAADVIKAGQKYDVPVYAPDVSGPTSRNLAVATEYVPVVGMTGSRINQNVAAGKAAERFVKEAQQKVGMTPYRGIKQVEQAAAKGDKKAKNLLQDMEAAGDDWEKILAVSPQSRSFINQQIASRKYDKVQKLAKDKTVPLDNLKKAVSDVKETLESDIIKTPELNTVVKQIDSGINKANLFGQVRRLRSKLGKKSLDAKKGLIGTDESQFIGKLQSALEKDIDNFGEKATGKLGKAFRDASRYYKNYVVPLQAKDLAKATKGSPYDEIFDKFIKKGKKGRADIFYHQLDPKGRAAIRAGIVERALNKSQGDEFFSPAKFANELERNQAATGVFFKGQAKKEIDGFKKLMQAVRRSGQVAENPPTGHRAAQLLTYGSLGAGALFEPTAAALTIGATAAIRRLFTSKVGRRLLASASTVDAKSPAMNSIMNRIGQFLQRAIPEAVTNEEAAATQGFNPVFAGAGG